jgi:FkbM family methyltransferase
MNDMVSRSSLLDNVHFLVRCLRYRFRTEKLQIKTMMALQLRGATVLDIGANKGIYCFWMMRAVGPSGRVIAFEPQPEMRDGIERQKRRFNWSNLRVMNVALSDLDGERSLSRQRIGDGSATLELPRRRSKDETLNVQVTKLDTIADEIFSNLKFMKCDVEGHEHNVFLGAEQTIRRYRPVVQFESMVTDERTQDIFQFFLGLGYSGVLLLGNTYLHYSNPEGVPHYKFGMGGHRDFLFFPPEAIGTTIPHYMSRQFPLAATAASMSSLIGQSACRSQRDGNQSVVKSRDRQAVEDLVTQYRIERATRWTGKIGLLIFALAAVAAVISLFSRK